jgi:putative phosphoesterase
VISDTHGLLRPEAEAALAGCTLIIHAGDVGQEKVLENLRKIAPVHAVRGNVDRGSWAEALPETTTVEVEGHKLYVLHKIEDLDIDPAAAGISAVIYGHSHVPSQQSKNGVLFLNPGSAGPRRFRLPVSIALLRITGRGLEVESVIIS